MWYSDSNPKTGSSEYLGGLGLTNLCMFYVSTLKTCPHMYLLTYTYRKHWVKQSFLHYWGDKKYTLQDSSKDGCFHQCTKSN